MSGMAAHETGFSKPDKVPGLMYPGVTQLY